METKKNEKYDLEPKRPLFFGIGMIIALAFVISAFEWRTEVEPIDVLVTTIDPPVIINIPITKIPEPPKPKTPRKAIQVVEAKQELTKTAEDIPLDIEDPFDDTDFTLEYGDVFVDIAEEPPFDIVEEMPTYPGGIAEFYSLLGSNVKYPNQAKRMGAEGKVFVKFIVEKDGSLSNFQVMKGVGLGCDQEAIRVMKLVPSFNPGKQRGVPVRVQMVVPINFQLK